MTQTITAIGDPSPSHDNHCPVAPRKKAAAKPKQEIALIASGAPNTWRQSDDLVMSGHRLNRHLNGGGRVFGPAVRSRDRSRYR